MSSGRPEDRGNTIVQLRNPEPIKAGKTWLRHRVDCQSGFIDLKLIEGKSSAEQIAKALQRSYPKKTIKRLKKRVEEHIDHLQDGDARDHSSMHKDDNHQPHKLKLKRVKGKWMFDLNM